MPEAGRQRDAPEASTDAGRLADHAAIARLTEDLLPALVAKLSTTQLGELEVREGNWQVRLRRPYGVGPGEGRRVTDKPSRSQPGHEGHGHGRAGVEGHRAGRGSGSGSGAAGSGSSAGPGAPASGSGGASAASTGVVVSSPAVGVFNPGTRAVSGTRVRAGDSLGTVNMLGIPQDIAAPMDGMVGATLVEAGTAVEYGQELIRLELTGPATSVVSAPAAEARR